MMTKRYLSRLVAGLAAAAPILLTALLLPAASAMAADTAKTYSMRNSGPAAFNLTLSETAGTLTTEINNTTNKTWVDASIASTTTFVPMGTWNFTGALSNKAIKDLGSASLWLGLATTDDNNLHAVVKTEVLKNAAVISTVDSACLLLVRVPSGAASIDLPAPGSAVAFGAGDTLSFRLSAKRCTPGPASGRIRVHYNRSDRNSNFGATVTDSADLSITKTDSPDPVTPGGALTYTVIVTNNGPNSATNVTMSDTLPASVSFVSATPTQGSCSGTTTVTCNMGTLLSGAGATVTLATSVSPSATGTISNTASATATEPDPTTPNTATAMTTVTPPAGADLSVTKTDSPDPVLQGQELTYTVTVTNNGPASASGVTLTDTLPAGVSFVSALPGQGTCSGTSTVTCNLGNIANGDAAVVTIKVKPGAAAATAGTIRNSATVSSSTTDPNPNPDNNTATADTAVTKDSDEDGIPDADDCTPTVKDDHVVGPVGVVPATFTGTRHDTLQAAVIAASDNQVISILANLTENVVIGASTGSGGKDLLIIGCSHRITSATGAPVIRVEVSAGADDGDSGQGERDIQFTDVDVRNGSGGYVIETSKTGGVGTDTLLKAIRAESIAGIGVKITGNGNEVRGANGVRLTASIGIQVTGNNSFITDNRIEENTNFGLIVTGNDNLIEKNKVGEKDKANGGGIRVIGNSNDVLENDVFGNTGDGINVSGAGNLIQKNDVGNSAKGNTGDGIHVAGAGNTVDENNIFANTGDGIDASGGTVASPNIVKNNDVGDGGKGNGGNGILVAGLGNATVAPVEIDNNTVKGNTLAGIKVTGSGHQLGDNESGGSGTDNNGLCEYEIAAANFDDGGNKANGASVALTIPGCTGTP